jgi:hypothetical protein
MANEQNNQEQNKSFGNTENQPKPISQNTENKTENSTNRPENSVTPQNKTASANTGNNSADATNNESVKDTAKGLYDQAKSTAGQAYGVATKRATEVLEEQKETLTDGLASVAGSIKQVGENLNNSPESNKIIETAAKYTNGLAEQIENVSNYFERKDVREMVSDVENFARKYPAYFIGGAFVAGILAARFLKSSSPKKLTKAAGQSFSSSSAKPAVNPS